MKNTNQNDVNATESIGVTEMQIEDFRTDENDEFAVDRYSGYQAAQEAVEQAEWQEHASEQSRMWAEQQSSSEEDY